MGRPGERELRERHSSREEYFPAWGERRKALGVGLRASRTSDSVDLAGFEKHGAGLQNEVMLIWRRSRRTLRRFLGRPGRRRNAVLRVGFF